MGNALGRREKNRPFPVKNDGYSDILRIALVKPDKNV